MTTKKAKKTSSKPTTKPVARTAKAETSAPNVEQAYREASTATSNLYDALGKAEKFYGVSLTPQINVAERTFERLASDAVKWAERLERLITRSSKEDERTQKKVARITKLEAQLAKLKDG